MAVGRSHGGRRGDLGVTHPTAPWVDPTAGLARPLRLGVLVSGSGTNLQAILDAVAAGLPIAPVIVVSNRPGVGALERAARAGVRSVVVDHRQYGDRTGFEDALLAALLDAGADVVALAGFMRLLSARFLGHFPLRTLNVHPALCPAFPGVNAPAQALAWGVAITGCTVHFVDAGTDTGPIITQAAVPVHPEDDTDSLHRRIQREEHRLLPLALGWLAEGRVRVEGRRVRVLSEAMWPSISTRS